MNGIMQLTILQVAMAYIFVLIVLLIIRIRGIKREKEVIWASLRMTIQLVLVGYLLVYVFEHPKPIITVSIIIIMETFAVLTIIRKFKKRLSKKLKRIIFISMGIGTILCITYFLLVVVRIKPWYDPQYFIPIAGMLIGNSMTGISLGLKNMLEGMTTQRALVEEALILGATTKNATKSILDSAFDSAILPTINSMLAMGVVFLPGMMTGQILSGTLPTTAIAYQIAIMLGIMGSVSLTVIIMLQLGYRTFFNKEDQMEYIS